jgi:hypothetical protein
MPASMSRAWGRNVDERAGKPYDLRGEWKQIKNQYDQYLASFAFVHDGLCAQGFSVS